MADISAFPALSAICAGDDSLLISEQGPIQTFVFAAATKAGQVVIYHGTSGSVTPAVGAITEKVAGVALYDVAAGAIGAVAMAGCIVKCTNASTTAAISPGVWVVTDDNAVLGTISALAVSAATALAVLNQNVVGITQETIAVSSSGYVLLLPTPITVGNNS